MAVVADRVEPLTDGELRRLSALVRNRIQYGAVIARLDSSVRVTDRFFLELVDRLIRSELERRRG